MNQPHTEKWPSATSELSASNRLLQSEAAWPLIEREIPTELLPLLPGHVAVGHIVNLGDKSLKPLRPDL